MYRTNIFSSLFTICLAVLLLVWVIPTQTPEYPGYGMPASLLPEILSWIMIACAVLNLVRTIVSGTGKDLPARISFRNFLHCLAFLVVLGAAMPLMALIGYWAGGVVVMACICLLCGERNWVRMAIVTAATVFVVWAALWKGLSVMLP